MGECLSTTSTAVQPKSKKNLITHAATPE